MSEAIYLVPFPRAEMSLAGSLLSLLRHQADRMPHFAGVDWGRALAWLKARTGTDLAPEQEQAVRLALTRGQLRCGHRAPVHAAPGRGLAARFHRTSPSITADREQLMASLVVAR